MKKTLSLFLTVIMIIGMMPLQALAEATSSTETKVESVEPVAEDKDALEIGDEVQPEAIGEGAITLARKGQWINESKTYQEEELKQYASENDIIGEQVPNGGLLRGLAKQFLAWSDLPPVDNGVLSEGAKLFLP